MDRDFHLDSGVKITHMEMLWCIESALGTTVIWHVDG